MMTGPLAPYESALRGQLTNVGYASLSVTAAVRVMRSLSAWMEQRDVGADELTASVVEGFVAARGWSRHQQAVARRWVGAVLRLLHGLGVLAAPEPADTSTVEMLVGEFREWLGTERGLAAESVRCYGNQAKKFLVQLPEPVEESLAGLDASAVTTFIVEQATAGGNVESVKALVTALRSLLRFLHVHDMITAPLVGAVPGVAG